MDSPPARLAVASVSDPAERSQRMAAQGRDAALHAIESELAVLRASVERCAALAQLHLAPPGLRDLFRRQGRASAVTIASGAELVRRAREDGLL